MGILEMHETIKKVITTVKKTIIKNDNKDVILIQEEGGMIQTEDENG